MSLNLKKSERLWEGLNRIKDDPEKMRFLERVLDVYRNKDKLTPEGLETLKRFERHIECIHQLYCKSPRPTPRQARSLVKEICELTKELPGHEKMKATLERDFAIH